MSSNIIQWDKITFSVNISPHSTLYIYTGLCLLPVKTYELVHVNFSAETNL